MQMMRVTVSVCVGMREYLVHEGKRINSIAHSHADLSLGTNLNSAIGSTSSSSLSSSSSSATDSFDSSRKGIKRIFSSRCFEKRSLKGFYKGCSLIYLNTTIQFLLQIIRTWRF